jgi:potassium-transporting ATPase potassium-binding subunit
MAKIFRGERVWLTPILSPLEKFTYRMAGVNSRDEMGWKRYAKNLCLFNLLGLLFLLLIQLGQHLLPLNPQNWPAVPWPTALNTAMSFVTNTNWQAYSGETSLSYLTQMCGLTVQNFLSAATGNATLLALIRGLVRETADTIGNFWVDLVRTIVYLLLPLALIFAVVLVSLGVLQSYAPYVEVETLEGAIQTLPQGPVASQVAIKQLGTNGGGFFGVNSAHPFENPNWLSNFLESLAIILIPASLIYTYGIMAANRRHGWLLLLVVGLLWGGGYVCALYTEQIPNPLVESLPLMEGKEVRFGVGQTVLWSTLTTATANGSVNGMLDSLSPLAGGVSLFNLLLGELIFGGIGVGLCSLLMFVLLTVFIAGLMVGRTPEYMGKKLEKKEMQWVVVAILLPAALILIGASLSSVFALARAQIGNKGPHGLTEILYAFASCVQNNGSAFAGLNVTTDYFNKVLTVCMGLGRLSIVIPSLAIAGSLVQKKSVIKTEGVFSTETFLFLILLLGSILIVGALTFFPALCLGPIVEQQILLRGGEF